MIENYVQGKLFELGRLDIVDLYEWHISKKLNYSAYFQRQYVWREKDKEELIDTIMSGYPIPAIFLCEASTDLNQVRKTYNVLDGRQRLESIFSFINNEFTYRGKTFGEMSEEEKSKITNYSIAIVQMYIKPTEVEKIKEIFKRLNKNSYKLNEIEIKSSQFVEYDFMIICKIVCGIIEFEGINDYLDEVKSLYEEENDSTQEEIIIENEDISKDLSENVKDICKNENISNLKYLLTKENLIFSKYQISRQVNLQHLINILGSVLLKQIIHRNLNENKIIELSNIENSEFSTSIRKLNEVNLIIKGIYEDDSIDKFWRNTSCYYTLNFLIYNKYDYITSSKINLIKKLNEFSSSDSEEFEEFKRFTQERTNDKSMRIKRNDILEKVILS